MAPNPFELEFAFRGKRFKDAQIGLNFFASEIGASITRAGPVLSREMKTFLDTTAEVLKRQHSGPWPGGTSGNSLSRRSGKGIQSIKKSIRVKGKTVPTIEGQIGGVFYLRTHEFGATIRAKKVKYLTIPLPAALTSRGIPKKRKARDWANTFVKRSRRGNLIIFKKQGQRIIPLYVLKRSVTIRPRLGMGKVLRAGSGFFIDSVTEAILKEFLGKR